MTYLTSFPLFFNNNYIYKKKKNSPEVHMFTQDYILHAIEMNTYAFQ